MVINYLRDDVGARGEVLKGEFFEEGGAHH